MENQLTNGVGIINTWIIQYRLTALSTEYTRPFMTTITSVHHINFVVKDLQPNIEYLSRLLDQQPTIDELVNRQVKTARFELNGSWIVLVQPLNQQGVVAKVLQEKGEGLFLLSLGVESLEESILQLEKNHIKIDQKGQRQGLSTWRVQDIDAPAALGPILQICQPK